MHRRTLGFIAMLLVVGMLIPAMGCLQFQRQVMRFDMKAGTGEVRWFGITSDGSNDAGTDFRELIEKYVQGFEFENENPLVTDVKKELYEENGQLNGVITFKFGEPSAARIYKHDKKSPWIYCVGAEQQILATNGKDISKVLPGCIAWERKQKVLDLTLAGTAVGGMGTPVSLMEFYRAWKKDGTLPPAVDPTEALEESLKALEDLEGLMQEMNPCAPPAEPNPCAPTGNPCAGGGI